MESVLTLCIIVHRISHETNVVVVSIQSNGSKKFLLFADWLFTTTTFVPWDILWAMVMTDGRTDAEAKGGGKSP